MVFSVDECWQLKNKIKAIKIFQSWLPKQKEDDEQSKYNQNRKEQVENLDRSEQILKYKSLKIF